MCPFTDVLDTMEPRTENKNSSLEKNCMGEVGNTILNTKGNTVVPPF